MNKFIIILLISGSIFGQQTERKLVWEENFDGKILNDKVWNIELGDGCPNCGWGNNERQLYTDKNHRLENGNLVITAKKDENGYTSTRITTKNKKEFRYGRLEARAKLPVGHGLWPAFWMLGANFSESGWPVCGEIDILEYIGREPHTVYTTLHTQDSHGNSVNSKKTIIPNIEEGYHVYAIEWTKDKIDFFVDKDLIYTFQPKNKNEKTWPFDKPFFFLVNMAIGGNFGGPDVDDTIFPKEFSIDYIKVYQ
ncbi:glycoside hydrolase family 16 protein [Flavobacterium aquicola]|uniref:Glycosyl hydrolase family 16 n=1 Tax=Flavobacterium aquicola TaxID=1682742 RepID=A0A3E0EVX2_9FLAO|nr:glycoside hydrolase family 16 protein [Flavobacterium aquicola]REH01861.1 glycosyl hydrolase family 16 [Flavobacterium aquicola]